jgi:hypothetical protein
MIKYQKLLIFTFAVMSCMDNSNPNTGKNELTNRNDITNEREVQIFPNEVFDTLLKHEKSKHYETDFMEYGCGLRSFLYQGIVNGQNFGIKTNCTDGSIIVYMKKLINWQVIDSIDENIAWNFKKFVT